MSTNTKFFTVGEDPMNEKFKPYSGILTEILNQRYHGIAANDVFNEQRQENKNGSYFK